MHDGLRMRIGCECCIRYKDEVLMQRRSPKSTFYPNYLSFPGGNVSLGETTLEAVIREVKEETNLDILPKQLRLCGSIVNIHLDKETVWLINTFKVRLSYLPEVIDSIEGKLEWINVKDIYKRTDIVPPLVPYLPRIFNGKIQTFFMSADLRNGHIVRINSELILNK